MLESYVTLPCYLRIKSQLQDVKRNLQQYVYWGREREKEKKIFCDSESGSYV